METTIVIIFLLIFIVIQEYFNKQERKKLIDAYLAKNITELKQAGRLKSQSRFPRRLKCRQILSQWMR